MNRLVRATSSPMLHVGHGGGMSPNGENRRKGYRNVLRYLGVALAAQAGSLDASAAEACRIEQGQGSGNTTAPNIAQTACPFWHRLVCRIGWVIADSPR